MDTVEALKEHLSVDTLPEEMRTLTDDLRRQAVELANSFIDQGYKVPIATMMAVETVQSWSNLSGSTPPYHVVPHPDGWAVIKADADKAIVVVDTKKEAVDQGREIARNQMDSLVIHGQDGMVQDEHNYENL